MTKPKYTAEDKLEKQCLKSATKLLKEKRTRPDVKARQARNKETKVTIVKTTLSTFCTKAAKALPWTTVLKEVNKTITEAYVLANIHVVRLCELGLTVSKLDQSFFYGCLSAVSVAGRTKTAIKDPLFRDSVELYRSWKPEGYQAPSSQYLASGWHQNVSLQMLTNTNNTVSLNFYRRFKRYLKHKHNLDGKQAYEVLKGIHEKKYVGDDRLVLHYRPKMPVPEYGRLEDNPHLSMPLQYEFLKHFEEHRVADTQPRLFSLLPFKQGFECSHLKMCSNGLYGLLKRGGYTVPTEGAEWRKVSGEWWRKLFNLSRFETCNRKFAGEILTDGKGVSVVLRRPKWQDSAPGCPCLADYTEVWGLDPGRRDLFVATNEAGEKQSCSTREFYEDAQYKKTLQKIRVWQEKDPRVLEAIRNMPTKKTASLEKLKVYVQFLLPRLDVLLDFQMRKAFRDLKFRRYVFAQKKLQSLCRRLTATAGPETLVGFGDWSNKDSVGIIKKSPAGPVKRFENQLRRYCKVVPVDEFRSSKLHSVCHHELKNRYSHKLCKKDGVERVVKVHSVLHCRHSGCSGITVNRDDNASINILHLLKADVGNSPRPIAFCRGGPSAKCSMVPPADSQRHAGRLSDSLSTQALLPARS